MLKVWNVVLIWLTFELTLFGTFLTRSGVVESVHSFALSPIGPMFAVFIILTILGFGTLVIWRLPLLRSENQLDGVLSRETSFLTQNVIFLVIMLATMLGTLFRPLSEILTGNKIALNAPYFQRVNGPIFLVLLVLMGAAPLLAWRRSAPETLIRNFAVPVSVGVLTIPLGWLLGNRSSAGFVGFAVLAFVFAGIVQEYVRGVRARQHSTGEPLLPALVHLVRRNGRRYGGYVVHIGVLLIAMGIIGNEFYQSEGQANLRQGESISVANYTLTFRGLQTEPGPNFTAYGATWTWRAMAGPSGQIRPKKVVYTKNQEQPMTEGRLRPGVLEDVYVVLAGFDQDGATASFKVYINPLMTWMWAGGITLILGVLLSAWPRRAAALAEARASVPAGTQPLTRCAHYRGRSIAMLIVLSILMVLAVLAALAYPVLRQERSESVSATAQASLHELLSERDQTLQAIRDLQFDHEVGKITDADLTTYQANLRQSAADALRRLDACEAELDREIGPDIASRVVVQRTGLGHRAIVCPTCGRPLSADDRFCTGCGATILPPARSVTLPMPPARTCPHCGKTVQAEDLFCPQCGQPLPQAVP